MSMTALLHGDPGRLPFVGHFRAVRSQGNTTLAIAGRVRAHGDVSMAFRVARTIETAILSCAIPEGVDRHVILSTIWTAIQEIEGCDLGPDGGEDLVILFATKDQDGTGIAGMGLGGVWAWNNEIMLPLVQGDHPLLGSPGRPKRLPGVLTLDEPTQTIVGIAHDHAIEPPKPSTWRQRCGVNP
jgi:hypothetical protein